MTPTDDQWVHTSDRVRLAVERDLADEPEAAVVVVHGFAASRDEHNVAALARTLAELGTYDVYRYDARGHGASGGVCTLGDAEVHDVAAMVAEARERCERVVVVGASMGAVAALRYAASDRALAGVVTVSSPDRWVLGSAQALLAAGLTRTAPGRWLARRYLRVRLARDWGSPEEPLALVARITVPLAVIHGADDRFIRPDAAGPLAARAAGPSRAELVSGMGHAYEPAALGPIRHAVSWVLGRSVAPA